MSLNTTHPAGLEIGPNLKVGGPVTDMLYGYNLHKAFPPQQAQLFSIGTEMVAKVRTHYILSLLSSSGDCGLWAATNQYLNGSVSCVNSVERKRPVN